MNWTIHEIPTDERESFLRSLNAAAFATTMSELAESTWTNADENQNESLCSLAHAAKAFMEILTSKDHKEARTIAGIMVEWMLVHIVAVLNSDDKQRLSNARSRKDH